MIEVSARGGTIVFSARVISGASRDFIDGEFRGARKIRLTAPPVGGSRQRCLALHPRRLFECARLGC